MITPSNCYLSDTLHIEIYACNFMCTYMRMIPLMVSDRALLDFNASALW